MRYEPDWGQKRPRSGGIKSIHIDSESNVLSLGVLNSALRPETVEFPGARLALVHYYENYPWQIVGDYFGLVAQLRITYLNRNNRKCRRVFVLPGVLEPGARAALADFADANDAAFDDERHLNPTGIITVLLFLTYLVMAFWRQW